MENDSLAFAQPFWFLGLLVLLVVLIIRQCSVAKSHRLLDQLVASRLKDQLIGSLHPLRRLLKFCCLIIGLAGVIVALARPQWGIEDAQSARKGLDVIFALDTSRSMLAEDIEPNRLVRARYAILDLMEILDGDRVGMVAFAGDAYLQCPLTTDYAAFKRILDEADTSILPTGGTNIANAIDEAIKGFSKSESGNRALILITDGEEHDAEALPKAREAYDDNDIRIFTMGFGTPEGTKITITQQGRTGVVQDQNGKPVISKLQENILKEVAEEGGGFYQRFVGSETLQRLAREGLASMTRADIDSRKNRRPIERYQWPLGLGLLFLFAGAAIHESKRKPKR